MTRLLSDASYVLRIIRVKPWPILVTVLCLSTGIGFAAFIIALADPFLLKPLPYRDPGGLVIISIGSNLPMATSEESLPLLSDWETETNLFDAVAIYHSATDLIRFRIRGRAVAIRAVEVSDAFFDVLGVQAPEWRSLRRWPSGEIVPILPLAPAFDRLLNQDIEPITGRSFAREGGGSVTVVGALPKSFIFPSRQTAFPIEAITPLATSVPIRIRADDSIIARMRPGIPPNTLAIALSSLIKSRQHLVAQVEVQRLDDFLKDKVRPIAIGGLIAGTLVVLIAAATTGNLLLVRVLQRTPEFRVLEALGATRQDLLRVVIIELVIILSLSLAVALVGISLVFDSAGTFVPAEFIALGEPSLTYRVWVLACTVGVVLTVPFGIIPASALYGKGWVDRIAVRPSGPRGVRATTIACQTALATMLVAGGVILCQSYINLVTRDDGFSGRILVATVLYPSDLTGAALQDDIDLTMESLRRRRGVEAVGAAVGSMLDRLVFPTILMANGQQVFAVVKNVSIGYFQAVGSTFVAGRSLTVNDAHGAGIVVNETFAQRAWPNGPVVGQSLSGYSNSTVVGVTKDELNVGLDKRPTPTVFVPLDKPWEGCGGVGCGQVSYVIRVSRGTSGMAGDVSHAVVGVDNDAVVLETSLLGDRLRDSVRDRSFAAIVVDSVALVSLFVCAVGIAGVVALVVARRQKEIAIRRALGATTSHVLWLVSREAGLAACGGLLTGLIAAHWTSATLRHLVYGMSVDALWPMVLTATLVAIFTLGTAVLCASTGAHTRLYDALRFD